MEPVDWTHEGRGILCDGRGRDSFELWQLGVVERLLVLATGCVPEHASHICYDLDTSRVHYKVSGIQWDRGTRIHTARWKASNAS